MENGHSASHKEIINFQFIEPYEWKKKEKKGKEVDATAGITFESSENEIKKDDLIEKILAVIVLICMFSLIKPIIKRKIEAES